MSNMKLILSVMFLLHGSQFAVTAAPSEQSPNILLIITDQQFAEAMSCASNPHVQTPAIDGLAARGMRFTESYCTSPVCAPSRGSILTGLFR
jgi:arylsulfatase A-like enzyme